MVGRAVLGVARLRDAGMAAPVFPVPHVGSRSWHRGSRRDGRVEDRSAEQHGGGGAEQHPTADRRHLKTRSAPPSSLSRYPGLTPMRFSRLSLLPLALVAVAACHDDGVSVNTRPPLGGVRFVNAVPDGGPVDIRMIDQVEWSASSVADNSVCCGLPFR